MNVYTSEKIRNVVLLGHGSCGKTTLVEAMAYTTGILKRQGRIEEGNTISDYDKEEQKRLFSISTTVAPPVILTSSGRQRKHLRLLMRRLS